jgi:ADP-ribose pyrophosphatase YjhB (NUDIX family)
MDRFALIPEAHLLLFREGHVLLLKRQNTGYEDGNYSVIAGHIEEGERASGGMIREAREEAGLEIARKDLRLCHIVHRKSAEERVSFFFTVERWAGEPSNREPDKCSDLSWFKLSSLPGNMVPYVRQAIENVLCGEVYSEHGWGG